MTHPFLYTLNISSKDGELVASQHGFDGVVSQRTPAVLTKIPGDDLMGPAPLSPYAHGRLKEKGSIENGSTKHGAEGDRLTASRSHETSLKP